MRWSTLTGLASTIALGVTAPAWAQTAPGAPGATAHWTTGAKQGVGTSTTTGSKVWFSLADGVLSEVYYPRVDVADSRALELVVSDGRTFTDRESTDTTHAVELVTDTALVYKQINTDKQRRYRITKTYVTDPVRATVLIDIDFEALDRGQYAVYALHDPAIDNSGRHDAGSVSRGALVASEGEIASALVADEPFSAVSNGYLGASDGWTDLATDHVMDWRYPSAPDGNVVQTARLALDGRRSQRLTLALGFGTSGDAAVRTAKRSLVLPFFLTKVGYALGWHLYLESLRKPPKSVGRGDLLQQYRVAAMQLKAHEDKTYRGANIASLTVPWGEAINADEAGVGGYHLVWARDLYQVSTAQIALGDTAAAGRSLDYLFDVQQKPDGSFPQNSLLDGTPYWGSLQLDEVAFPIVLAWQLGRRDAATYRDHVKPAADFIVARGPATPQERWEEESGYSPSTIAAEIAGLTAAASLAKSAGDSSGAALYQGVADEWQRRVEAWTFTTTGPHGDGRYFERIDDNGNPNDGHILDINNGGGAWDERLIVDAGFLDLVRLGTKRWNDPFVVGSLPEVDSVIRVGDLFYRYNHDGYGEKADGSPYDGTGIGRLWPLLSGERGEYELLAGRPATKYLRALAESANEGWMIPEQVWDQPDIPAYDLEFGEGTGSATPLAWAMAAYVRLAHSIDAGRPVATPSVVADRYTRGTLPASPSLTVTSPADGSTTGAATATVAGTTDATAVYVNAGGTTTRIAGGTFSATVPLGLGVNQITVVAVGVNGGTATVQRTVTSTNFGAALGSVSDPAGDDNGPGDYVYPADPAFNPGAYDLTAFGVYDDGRSYNFVTTIAGELRNPWGGNQIAIQRINVYGKTGTTTGAVPALGGTNANLEAPYDWVLTADGFNDLGVRDATGATVAGATLLALPSTRQIVASVPKTAFPAGLAGARYAVVMASHGGDGEGTGHIRPVYDRAYWESTAGTGMSWIHDFRLGGGAGEFTDANEARDTDTRDPNVVDVLVPAGSSQADVLNWRAAAPVTLRYVPIG